MDRSIIREDLDDDDENSLLEHFGITDEMAVNSEVGGDSSAEDGTPSSTGSSGSSTPCSRGSSIAASLIETSPASSRSSTPRPMDRSIIRKDLDDDDENSLLEHFGITDEMAVNSEVGGDSSAEDGTPSSTGSSGSGSSTPCSRGSSIAASLIETSPGSSRSSTPRPVSLTYPLYFDRSFSMTKDLPGPSGVHSSLFSKSMALDNEQSSSDFDEESERRCKKARKEKRLKSTEPASVPSSEPHVHIDIENPKNIFFLFFTKIMMNHILFQTNLYAEQRNKMFKICMEEMEAFLGMLIIMGIHEVPTIRHYWPKNKNFSVERINSIMSLKRFLSIFRFLHFNDNSKMPKRSSPNFDKLYKTRPLLDYLNERFRQLYQPSWHISEDERTVKYKRMTSMKQYILLKLIRRGFKVWVLACSQSGYAINLDVYTGKKYNNAPGLGLEETVKNTVQPCLKGVLKKLPGRLLGNDAFSHGTVMTKRKGFYKNILKGDGEMKKSSCSNSTQSVCVSKRKDHGNRPAYITSSKHNRTNSVLKTNPKIEEEKEICQVHAPTADYSQNMGSVLFDQLLGVYTTSWKSRRWWVRLFYHLFDAAIVNSYILYKSTFTNMFPNRKPMSHLEYRSKLADELIGAYNTSQKTGRYVSCTYIRFANAVDHIPIKLEKNRHCANCSFKKIRKMSIMACKKCNVALCVECFEPFHAE